MMINGVLDTLIVEGAVNTALYEQFLFHVIHELMNPFPDEASVLVMDNCSIHRSQGLRDMCNNT
jgi:hypothetical protein